MTNAEIGLPGMRSPFPPAAAVIGGPCAPVRAQVDSRCTDAERLVLAAQAHQQKLSDARREHAEVALLRDADAKLRDRRRLAEEKTAAQAKYHDALIHAPDQAGVQSAAASWLRRVDQLNRQSRIADERADSVAQRVAELERALPGLELAADAARIAAEAAQVGCLEARRSLAACEEENQQRATGVPPDGGTRIAGGTAPASAIAGAGGSVLTPRTPRGATPAVGQTAALGSTAWSADARALAEDSSAPVAETDQRGILNAVRALMRGDRPTLLGLALRLADETGFEAGRLQLLLLELREQVATRALDDLAFSFPEGHPFWSQFPADGARKVAASLASMGYRFDGRGGWADSRTPQTRDLAYALSYCGHDPRTLRRPAGQAALDALWLGTTVRSEEYLLARAPEMTLAQIVTLLGPRSSRLAELWDIWGRLRPLLMRVA